MEQLVENREKSKPLDGGTLQECKPARQFVYAKTHKTGSSTVQNILFRQCDKLNISIAFPHKKTWMFSFKGPFQAEDVFGYPQKKYDAFLFHSIWNYPEVKKVVPKGPTFTIIRDPIATFESGYSYFGMNPRDINKFALNLEAGVKNIRDPRSYFGKNQLLWDLGFNATAMENKALVKEKIKELNDQFELVMIAEEMDKSLLLLQDVLCWPIESIAYLKQNQRVSGVVNQLTRKTREILRKWLWADYMLYDYFVEVLKARLDAYGDEVTIEDNLKSLEAAKDKIWKCATLKYI